MTNDIAPNEMTAAGFAAEYAIHAASGEPEGCVDASSPAEALELWALDNLRNGDSKLVQVFEGSGLCGWFKVERERESATARECSV